MYSNWRTSLLKFVETRSQVLSHKLSVVVYSDRIIQSSPWAAAVPLSFFAFKLVDLWLSNMNESL